jgi:hypothetical protein
MASDMVLLLSRVRRHGAKLGPRLLDDRARGGQRQDAHDRGNGEVGPAAAGAEDPQRGDHHRQVADRIVAAAQPDRAHVGVALAPRVEHRGDRHIGQQCQGADGAHRHRLGYGAGSGRPGGAAEHEDAEGAHGQALEEGGARAPSQRHAEHEQRDAVVGRVAKEVHGVGQQRHRSGLQATGQLDGEHGDVDDQRGPQHAAVARALAGEWGGATVAAAGVAHEGLSDIDGSI